MSSCCSYQREAATCRALTRSGSRADSHATEDITEHLVEAVGPCLGAGPDQEEVGCLERLEPVCCVVSSGEGPASVGVELVERGEGEEAVEALCVELSEHLAGEVVGDVVIGSGEGFHEGGRVGVVAQRERRQVHPGGPAFCSRRQRFRVVGGELDAVRGDHPRGVVRREAQIVGSQLAEDTVGPPPVQGQRRVGSAAQDERHTGWESLDQETERRDGVGRDHVQVVDHQGGTPVEPGKVVHERRHHVIERERVFGEQCPGLVPDPVAQVCAGGDDRHPEPAAVGVGDVACQPGPRSLRPVVDPVGQEHRLARPGQRGDQRHRVLLDEPVERGHGVVARHDRSRRPGRSELCDCEPLRWTRHRPSTCPGVVGPTGHHPG